MEDIIKIVLQHIEKEYSAKETCLFFCVNMEFDAQIRFELPNYNIRCAIPAKDIIFAYNKYGKEDTLAIVDNSITNILIDFRRRFMDD